MPKKQPPKGKCAFCGQDVAKNGVTKHLTACAKWNKATTTVLSGRGKKETLYHIRVQAAGMPEFWLDLEMRGSAALADLDSYLRAIWLECCGHMSQFSFGGWRGEEISMRCRIADVLKSGAELTHIYDFGTESITLIRTVRTREAKPVTSHPITLLARNVMPECKCMECEQPATFLCTECLIEENMWGVLCNKHAKSHPHDNYGEPVRLVNSPRLGLCGYTGPAEPPY